MLNERDGGIGGEKIIVQECEDGYDTQKGVQCYDSVKDRNPVVITPYSTGITEQLIPKAAVDKIPILSMSYGLSASADGQEFPWIFNPPDTYWDGASAFIRHVADVEGGFAKLKGKTIGLIYLDAPYGKEPIPLLQSLAKDYGYTIKLYPVEASQMQNQDSVWLDIRRDRPDRLYLQGWGAMNPTAVEDAAKNNFRMDHLVGVWWSGGDQDARPAGAGGKGYTTLDINGVGDELPGDPGHSQIRGRQGQKPDTERRSRAESLQPRGHERALIAQGIRNAQKLTGKKLIDGAAMRRGLEALNVTEARWKEIGLPGFAEPIHLSCTDHNGHDNVFLVQWDGTKWTEEPGSIAPIHDKVQPLIDGAAQQYVKANAGWPKRSEACERSS